MSASSLVIISASFLLQIAGGRLLASPWWMPDLALAGLMLAMMRERPATRGALCLVALLAMLFSAGHSPGTGVAYLVAGGTLVWMSAQWEWAQPSMQLAALGVAEGALLLLGVVLHKTRLTWGLLPLVILRIGMTVLSWPLLRRLMGMILRVP